MRSWLAMLFYIDHKCDTQPGFRKTLLVFTLIFVFLLWSPWRPLLCPVCGVCPAPVVRADANPQPKPRRVKRTMRLAPTPDPVRRRPRLAHQKVSEVAMKRSWRTTILWASRYSTMPLTSPPNRAESSFLPGSTENCCLVRSAARPTRPSLAGTEWIDGRSPGRWTSGFLA
jgi:hypothetical protein